MVFKCYVSRTFHMYFKYPVGLLTLRHEYWWQLHSFHQIYGTFYRLVESDTWTHTCIISLSSIIYKPIQMEKNTIMKLTYLSIRLKALSKILFLILSISKTCFASCNKRSKYNITDIIHLFHKVINVYADWDMGSRLTHLTFKAVIHNGKNQVCDEVDTQ